MDIVGPLHKATGNRKFLLVATDYFTKWIEAEPLAKITEPMIERFVWKNIITRFGVPYSLITDNGSQFQKKFKAFCAQYGIRNYYSTPAYPQSNGQAEASNKTILDGIKKRLDKAKRKWPDELPLVLWAHRTTPRRSTGETPYSLAYGTEAVIPLEVGLPTNRTALVESGGNDRALEIELDLAEERRERALVHLASYQEQLMKSYNKNVHP
jgi:transposase InsO family protein